MAFIVYGIHAVKNIINSPQFIFKEIILREELQKDLNLLNNLRKKNISHKILSKVEFSRLSFPKKNQGLVALIYRYNYINLDVLLSSQPHKPQLLIMLDNIEDPHNFGAILRTAAAFSVDGVIISARNQVPVNATVIRVSVGGIAYVPVCKVENLTETINKLQKKEFKVIATVCDKSVTEYKKMPYFHRTCIVFGNEYQGIKKNLIKKSDYSFFISLNENISSLNVSVSCGIFLSQLSKLN